MAEVVFDYLDPPVPAGLRVVDVPVIDATESSIKGFGQIVRDPHAHRIEIVKWPVRGWRRLDAGTGDDRHRRRRRHDGGRLRLRVEGQPSLRAQRSGRRPLRHRLPPA
ncbi:MAG: hypothetical protein FJX20_09330, partial [Alphaproteobacteria bacterium]|nr:hypothetical protein [Alphaproteobacteria bacterium]